MLARGPESAVLELPRREASKGGSALTAVDSVPPPDAVRNQRMEIDPVETASSPIEASAPIEASSPINSPKPRGGFSPPRAAEMPMIDQRGVASVVQPPAIVAPAALANPFQKAWLR
jgi:hypothetical protein